MLERWWIPFCLECWGKNISWAHSWKFANSFNGRIFYRRSDDVDKYIWWNHTDNWKDEML